MMGTATQPMAERLPPLRPWRIGGKIAISCERPGEWLIRAWTPTSTAKPERLVDWICHYIGRMDMPGLEWWGFTYPGQPYYMRPAGSDWSSGLTIQSFVTPPDEWTQKLLDEGRIGPAYGEPLNLKIPESGVVQIGVE